jgi:uncharacterized protein YbbC (DUF1343 family)
VTERKRFRPVETALAVLRAIMDMCPGNFEWAKPPYEYTFDRPPIDMIFGTDEVRNMFDAGMAVGRILKRMEKEVKDFGPIRRRYLSY